MSEEMNKELETEVIAGVTAEEPVETMEDFAAELEASYKTLNKRNIELSEEESGQGAKWAQFAQMMEDKTVVKVKINEAVKGGVVTSLEEVRAFIPASQLSTEYVEKLEDWQGRYVECVIITVDPEKKRLVLSGREVERGRKEAERPAMLWKEPWTASSLTARSSSWMRAWTDCCTFPRSAHRGLSIRVQCLRKDRPLRLRSLTRITAS